VNEARPIRAVDSEDVRGQADPWLERCDAGG
jgi:hypothetical protein